MLNSSCIDLIVIIIIITVCVCAYKVCYGPDTEHSSPCYVRISLVGIYRYYSLIS